MASEEYAECLAEFDFPVTIGVPHVPHVPDPDPMVERVEYDPKVSCLRDCMLLTFPGAAHVA